WRGQRLCSSWGLTRALCVSPVLTDGVPNICCIRYQERPIPRHLVRSAFVTSSSCAKPAVMVVTKKDRLLCGDPEAKWVKELLKHFQSLEN
ncbi:CCL5 protein, partial [Chloropsis hardwickii]|nr:CCL5 protein [Chloropsis hardwickii]